MSHRGALSLHCFSRLPWHTSVWAWNSHDINQGTMKSAQLSSLSCTASKSYLTASLPFQGNLSSMNRAPDLNEVQELLSQAQEACLTYQQRHPAVQNLSKLVRRIEKELQNVQQMMQDHSLVLKPGRLQGVINNLRGFHGEVLAVHEAPHVLAVCKRFSTAIPSASSTLSVMPALAPNTNSDKAMVSMQESATHPAEDVTDDMCQINSTARCSSLVTAASQQQAASGSCEALQVEVDVVACNGLAWIEVKNQELFGVDSVHFAGSNSYKGLKQQVMDLVTVAAAPVNIRHWRTPEVVVYFPSGVTTEVAAAIAELGATVADGPGSLHGLLVPQTPQMTNLDVTALCVLVSEVTWGDCSSQELTAWAQRTHHWQECLNAQQARPVLDDLQECLSSRQQLVTSCTAVHQFQKLVDAFAGQREHRRWQELQQRLQVYHLVSSEGPGQQCNCDFLGHPAAADCSDDRCSCNSMVQQYKQPERIVGIKKMTEQQKAVFGLGEVLKAITLTANGNAIRSALSAGVHLECVLHRPIWLTGL